MTSFVIGRVVEPEVREITAKGQKRKVCSVGVLSGRNCNQFDIFDDSKVFEKVSKMKDGALVLAVVSASVDNRGQLRCYLNGIGDCPDGLRNQLISLAKS